MSKSIKYSEFRKLFFNPKINKRDLVRKIKISISEYEDIVKFENQFRKDLKSATSLLDRSLYGQNPLPTSYEILNKDDSQHYIGSLKHELNWLVKCLVDFKSEIGTFLTLKMEFEDLLFKGKYSEARKILSRIEAEICVSLWGIENRFILDEYEFGTEENWNSRKLFLKSDIEPFVQSFSNIFSVRAEKSISFFHFNNEIDKWLHVQGILDSKELYSLNEYLRFKGNYFSFSNYSQYSYFIFQEAGASVLDKYVLFTRICSHLVLNDEYKDLILKLVRKVNEVVNDSFLRNLLTYEDSDESINLFSTDNDFLKIVDLYTVGEYKQVINEVKHFFNSYKTGELQLIELYVKSICEIGDTYTSICSSNSILDNVGLAMYKILMKLDDTEDSLIELVNYSYLLSNTRHGLFIYNFVGRQLGWSNTLNYEFMYAVNSLFLNPIMLATSVQTNRCNYSKINELNTSLGMKVVELGFNINKLDKEDYNKIPTIKKELYTARFLMNSGSIEEAKNIYTRMIEDNKTSIIAQFEIYSSLYECNLKDENFREAIKLFVEVNAKNPNLTRQMNYEKLLQGVIKGKFKNVGELSSLMELPIFFRINSNDRIRIKQSLELFLKSLSCTKPTELIEFVGNFEKNNVLYFFKTVCSVEILQLSKTFKSTFLVNEERISICKFLAEFDSVNSNRYKEEIADLTQRNTISKVIARIDERKIFVNQEKLKQSIRKIQKQNVFQNESLSPLNHESFERYVKLHKYIKENNEYRNISPVSFNEEGEVQVTDETILDTFDVIFYYPAFQIFSTFFLHIRNIFVFNKENGLDTYLSTKIRHGTLPNHLRSVFETFHLVTTQSNNEYVDNEYWKGKLNLSPSKEKSLQKYLAEFSKSIDNYSKKIKDDYIQCNSEIKVSSPEAEFDYSYTEQDQIQLYITKFHSIYEIDEFIEMAFGELWGRTELILEKIRGNFNGEYRDNFLHFLSELETNLSNNFEKEEVNELLSQIMTCRTDIQHKLNNISQWFRRSESSYEGDYKVEVLAQTSIEITKNIHPNYSFRIDTELTSSATVKGEHHEHFIDLMNNCLFNMIEHSHLNSNELNAKLKISECDEELVLVFSNNVENPNEHTHKLSEIKENWGRLDPNIAQEKGTGFPKVKKIISSDLNRKNSKFNYKQEGNNIEIELMFELNEL